MSRSIAVLALALFCAGCSSVHQHAETGDRNEPGVIELRPAGGKAFVWKEKTYSIQELNAALAVENQTQHIQRINLLDGDQPTTIADVIDIAFTAKTFGASPYIEKDGKLQPITLEVTE